VFSGYYGDWPSRQSRFAQNPGIALSHP
jgi:hypothetical protein